MGLYFIGGMQPRGCLLSGNATVTCGYRKLCRGKKVGRILATHLVSLGRQKCGLSSQYFKPQTININPSETRRDAAARPTLSASSALIKCRKRGESLLVITSIFEANMKGKDWLTAPALCSLRGNLIGVWKPRQLFFSRNFPP